MADAMEVMEIVSAIDDETATEPRAIDFSDLSVYTGTRPNKCVIDGETVSAASWSAMYVGVVERLLVTRNRQITSIKLKTISGGAIPLLMDAPLAGLNCAKLSNGKYLNTKYSAPRTISRIGMLCDACDVKKEAIGLTCWMSKTKAANVTTVERDTFYNAGTPSADVDHETIRVIELVLAERYANGFRLGSFIETERLRKFVNELLHVPLTLTDAELESYVESVGTVFGGKVYVVSADTKAKIKTLAEEYFDGGASAIFYEEFYPRHESWLIEASVVSEEMLPEILRRAFPKKQFTDTYFGDTRDHITEVVKRELLRVWGDDVLLTFETMDERLTYIPLYRIRQSLGGNADFIWNAAGEYTHVSKIDITEEEKVAIRAFAKSEVDKHGYVSIADFPFGEIPEKNCELSQTAVHNAVFHICLSDTYEQHGKIITRKGDNLTAKDIMDEYCRSLDHCTLDELLNFERELTGECHRWIPMQAGYDIMVRTDKNTYLADKFLDFDCSTIDNAVEHFVNGGEYVPLRHVTTFAPFPHCGQAWTLFLLESYCRRFSKRFRFEALSVNSTNAGAIVRKHSRLNYHDIMVDAVSRSGVALNANAVLEFLATDGYTSQRRYAKVNELITQATTLRG
jgi:hypothetical protein